jgi:hypothetical protein
VELIKLRVDFKNKLPPQTWPEDVRRVALGIVEDAHPAYEVVCNHKMIYPRLHFCRPGPSSFYFQGIGQRGKKAIIALMEAFATKPVFLDGHELTFDDLSLATAEKSVGPVAGLLGYEVKSPLLLWEKFHLNEERTGDLVRDAEDALKRHFLWLQKQFDVDVPDLFIKVQNPKEVKKSLKKNMVRYPAIGRATILTNMNLPPAIGHGVGLGWGSIRQLPLEKIF